MDDGQIVPFYWDRDERAIPATADKYGNYCTAIAKNILGNPEDAEECVNDTSCAHGTPCRRTGPMSCLHSWEKLQETYP